MNKIFSAPVLALLGTTLLLGFANAETPVPFSDDSAPEENRVTGMRDNSLMTSDADRQALMETAQGSIYDRATAELAVQKARNQNVQRYAMRLMDAHNKLTKMLLMQANKRGLLLPLRMKSEDNEKLQLLMAHKAGNDFDVAYLREAIRINTDDVLKGNEVIGASEDSHFRSLMHDFVNTEQIHLDKASQILAEIERKMGVMDQGLMKTQPE